MNLLLTNVVYGSSYSHIFLNYHLKSLLDESNLPAIKGKVSVILFTDSETLPVLQKHPNMMKLLSLCEVDIRDFTWKPNANKFALRYDLLINTFRQGAEEALRRGDLLSAWTADMIIAKGVLPKLMYKIMEDGHDAVLLQPARAAFEAIMPDLDKTDEALYPHDLWKLCQLHMHPYLTAANHWRSPTFTKYPFYMHWNTGTGFLTRSFSTTPIIMRPIEEMTKVKQVIDIEVPGMFPAPYWADEFDEFGVIQIEPTLCYNHALTSFPPQLSKVQKFAKDRHPHQHEAFKRRLYYPNKFIANVSPEVLAESDLTVKNILNESGDGRTW